MSARTYPVVAAAAALVLSTPVATWWLSGGQLPTAVIRSSIDPSTERLVGAGTLVVVVVSALALVGLAVRQRGLDRRWSWVVGALVLAGFITGYGARTLALECHDVFIRTSFIVDCFPASAFVLYCVPVIGALLIGALGRSVYLLTAGRRVRPADSPLAFDPDTAFDEDWA